MRPICPRRKRACRSLHGIVVKPFRLANERHEFGQQHIRVFALEDVNVAGTHAVKVRNRHLALVRAALAEEHLSALEGAGESCPVRDVAPTANMQVLWLDVFESHKAVNPCGGRVRCAGGGEGDDGGEFDGLHKYLYLDTL